MRNLIMQYLGVLWVFLAITLIPGCNGESASSSAPSDTANLHSDGAMNTGPFSCSEEEALKIYDRRIAPLVSGEVPSSCNQCHLSGVELDTFVQATPCETMGCLTSLELVNLENPKESSILAQIQMAEPDSALITAEVLQKEYEGFLEWILYQSECFDSLCTDVEKGCNAPAGGTPLAEGVMTPLGTCTEANLVATFEEKVFEHRKRCQGCHGGVSDHPDSPPYWMDTTFTEDDMASMTQSAMYSMYNLIGLGAIDTQTPEKSTMLCRHLDVAAGGCGPGDHIKFQNKADPAYGSMEAWVQLYATCFGEH